MIAVCTKCHTIFEDRGIVIVDAQNVCMHNNITRCPRCKAEARYLDGTFNFDSHGIATVLSAPQFTVEILNRVRRLLEAAQEKEITPEDFRQEVDNLPPLIGQTLKLIIPKEPAGFWTMIGALLLIINSLIGPKPDETHQRNIEKMPNSVEIVNTVKRDSTNIETNKTENCDDTLQLDED